MRPWLSFSVKPPLLTDGGEPNVTVGAVLHVRLTSRPFPIVNRSGNSQ